MVERSEVLGTVRGNRWIAANAEFDIARPQSKPPPLPQEQLPREDPLANIVTRVLEGILQQVR